jgi:hypothetical protein
METEEGKTQPNEQQQSDQQPPYMEGAATRTTNPATREKETDPNPQPRARSATQRTPNPEEAVTGKAAGETQPPSNVGAGNPTDDTSNPEVARAKAIAAFLRTPLLPGASTLPMADIAVLLHLL